MTRSPIRKTLIGQVLSGLFAAAAITGSTGVASAQERSTEYAQVLASVDVTTRYNATIEQQIRSQEAEIASLEQQIAELDTTAVEVQPLLQRMFDEFVAFVGADLPFLSEEREARVQRLRDLMQQVDASPSEKFRRLIEAYTIEMEYGRTMETYKGMLEGREVDFVRLGRVTLMYKAIEGSEAGYWDAQQRTWVVDEEHTGAIEQALRIAKEEEAPDLITVPVPAPGGRS
jgi:hypothetical protein